MSYPSPLPQRVLMTADTVGGVWNYALALSAELAERGVEVTVAAMGGLPNDAQQHAAAQASVQLHARPYRLEWMQDCWLDVKAAGEWLLELARENRPDVVHLNGYAHAALPFAAPKLVVGHSCVYSWFAAVRRCKPPAEFERYRGAVRRGLRAADHVVAPTAAMLAELTRWYGPLPRREVIPNGLAPSALPSAAAKEPLILTVGRLWDEAKNIAALAAIADASEWPIAAAGACTHPDDGRTRDLPALQTLGTLAPTELAEWYRRAAIFALPARYEPFGLAALEAGLAGCALVLGDIPTLREVWSDAATFVPPDDHAALAAAVRTLIAAPTRRREFAQRAHRRARAYTAARMTDAYCGLYRAMTAESTQLSTGGPCDPQLRMA